MVDRKKLPSISIIIPLYNAEKYISQCLDSIFTQTFSDYEVIIVDDCSTDQSVKIVDEIIGRKTKKGELSMRLFKLQNNSGGASIPRNIGIRLAIGKYVCFVDSDDMLVNNALQILYDTAEQFNADVVHTEKYFGFVPRENAQPAISVNTLQSGPFVTKPTLETNDLAQRVIRFCQRGYLWTSCGKLYRREFLVENQIEFLNIYSEDLLFVASCMCLAKNYVRIPQILYVYRYNPKSQTNSHTLEKDVWKMVTPFVGIINSWNKYFGRISLFTEHPEYKFMLLNFFLQLIVWFEGKVYLQIPPHIFDPIVQKNISLIESNNTTAAMAHMFNSASITYRQNLQLQQRVAELEARLKKLKSMSTELLTELQK